MRAPGKFIINVVDSPAKIHSIDQQYEILVRLGLLLFARDPDKYAVVHSELYKSAVCIGFLGKGFENERFITPELCHAMQNNKIVSYRLLY
jgi:hypothetical protein